MINATGNRMTFEIARQARLARAIEQTQIAISTGNRLQRPSDDPSAASRVATIRQSQADSSVWSRNIGLGASLAAHADGVARTLNDRLARAQELMVQGASDTLPPSGRATIAAEIRAIAEEIGSLAATRSSLGQPLFSAGPARAMRFADGVIFAPVPSRAELFESGGVPLSQKLQDMAGAIDSGDRAQLDSGLATVEALVRHGADAAASLGNTAARLDRLADSGATRRIEFAAERSALEDTDFTVAIATLNAQQLTLEAAQAAFARINRRSLIDLLS